MITESILDILFNLIITIFDGLPDVPSFPDLQENIMSVLTFLFGYLNLLDIFVRPITFKICIPIIIGLSNFAFAYHFVMWLLRKIPLLNIK